MLISPSAVWISFGRVPRPAFARSALAAKKTSTSSATARCKTNLAPSRPSLARCSLASPSPVFNSC
jgi:hypothetical protein